MQRIIDAVVAMPTESYLLVKPNWLVIVDEKAEIRGSGRPVLALHAGGAPDKDFKVQEVRAGRYGAVPMLVIDATFRNKPEMEWGRGAVQARQQTHPVTTTSRATAAGPRALARVRIGLAGGSLMPGWAMLSLLSRQCACSGQAAALLAAACRPTLPDHRRATDPQGGGSAAGAPSAPPAPAASLWPPPAGTRRWPRQSRRARSSSPDPPDAMCTRRHRRRSGPSRGGDRDG